MKIADDFFMSKTANNEDFKPVKTAVEHVVSKPINDEELKPVKTAVEDAVPKAVNNKEFQPVNTAVEYVVAKTINDEDLKPVKTAGAKPIQDLKAELIKIKNVKFEPTELEVSSEVKDVDSEPTKLEVRRAIEPAVVMEPRILMSDEEQKLFKDVEEMKSKLRVLESKLSEVSSLTKS